MKRLECIHCAMKERDSTNFGPSGKFFRSSDSVWIQRYRCRLCKASFSTATFHSCYRQKKRHKNLILRRLLCSGVSQRRCAEILHLNRTTVVRKFLFLALEAEFFLRKHNLERPLAHTIEFDDLESIEHAKLKPLSVTLAVEMGSRRILAIAVSRMAAKGLLAKKGREKYGKRVDERAEGREKVFRELKAIVAEKVVIKSDENPHYEADVKRHFPQSLHLRYKGKRGSLSGQGELKKTRFDPIFSLNHTCAMLRANINRLFRKTWCTTKRSDRLYRHLVLYAQFHNERLPIQSA
jgi:transposase-like protein